MNDDLQSDGEQHHDEPTMENLMDNVAAIRGMLPARTNARWRFERSISIGNLLVIVAMVFAVLTAWFTLEGRVARGEDMVARHQQWIQDHDKMEQKQTEAMNQISMTLALVKQEIDYTRQERERRSASMAKARDGGDGGKR